MLSFILLFLTLSGGTVCRSPGASLFMEQTLSPGVVFFVFPLDLKARILATDDKKERLALFRQWAAKHAGSGLVETQSEIRNLLGVGAHAIPRIFEKFRLVSRHAQSHDNGDRLREWAETHRGQALDITMDELAAMFNMHKNYIFPVLKPYEIDLANGKLKGGHRELRAWAIQNRGKSLDMTVDNIAKKFNVPYGPTYDRLRDYGITTHNMRAIRSARDLRNQTKGQDGKISADTQSGIAIEFDLAQQTVSKIFAQANIRPRKRTQRPPDNPLVLRAN